MSMATSLLSWRLTVSFKICASRKPLSCIFATRFVFASSYLSSLNLPGPNTLNHALGRTPFINLVNCLLLNSSFPVKLMLFTFIFLFLSTSTTTISLLAWPESGLVVILISGKRKDFSLRNFSMVALVVNNRLSLTILPALVFNRLRTSSVWDLLSPLMSILVNRGLSTTLISRKMVSSWILVAYNCTSSNRFCAIKSLITFDVCSLGTSIYCPTDNLEIVMRTSASRYCAPVTVTPPIT